MSIINNQDWTALSESFRNAEPYPHICIDNFLDEEFALKLSQSYPAFSSAKSIGKEFRTVNERGKVQVTNSQEFPEPVKQLYGALSAEKYLRQMESLSGVNPLIFDHTFSGGGMHMTSQSGILDVHVDFNRSDDLGLYRRLNLLIYLNEEWKEEWGGRLEVWNSDVSKCVKNFLPEFNRCVIFATSDISFHGVTAVNSPLDIPRKSFAIYLYNENPAASRFGESHSTIFKARPNENMKKYISMPTEKFRRRALSGIHFVKRQIKKVVGRV